MFIFKLNSFIFPKYEREIIREIYRSYLAKEFEIKRNSERRYGYVFVLSGRRFTFDTKTEAYDAFDFDPDCGLHCPLPISNEAYSFLCKELLVEMEKEYKQNEIRLAKLREELHKKKQMEILLELRNGKPSKEFKPVYQDAERALEIGKEITKKTEELKSIRAKHGLS